MAIIPTAACCAGRQPTEELCKNFRSVAATLFERGRLRFDQQRVTGITRAVLGYDSPGRVTNALVNSSGASTILRVREAQAASFTKRTVKTRLGYVPTARISAD
jgi:hypothetical protein